MPKVSGEMREPTKDANKQNKPKDIRRCQIWVVIFPSADVSTEFDKLSCDIGGNVDYGAVQIGQFLAT